MLKFSQPDAYLYLNREDTELCIAILKQTTYTSELEVNVSLLK